MSHTLQHRPLGYYFLSFKKIFFKEKVLQHWRGVNSFRIRQGKMRKPKLGGIFPYDHLWRYQKAKKVNFLRWIFFFHSLDLHSLHLYKELLLLKGDALQLYKQLLPHLLQRQFVTKSQKTNQNNNKKTTQKAPIPYQLRNFYSKEYNYDPKKPFL